VTWALIFEHTVGFSLPRLANLATTRRFISGRPLPIPIRLSPVARMVFTFQAGSYMYYSKWRNQLAEMAGLGSAEAVRTNPEKKGLPFVELIDFSDCEGVIGPKVAAKLAKDFADYEFSASAFAVESEDDFFLALYREWRRAFEWAADGGMVYFG
jgi:hypothetical protein